MRVARMKIVIAPDSFKHALRSPAVAAALAAGWRERRPGDLVIELPLADGGEGTCEALMAALNGKRRAVEVSDPLGRRCRAEFGLAPAAGLAVAEMAAASGIELLAPDELNPLAASSYGFGELIRSMLDTRMPRLLLGIGGSATVDGGIGMLQALGARFFDRNGAELPPKCGGGALIRVAAADFSGLDDRLAQTEIEVACDVINPLTGPHGAAAVFGPQKGASPAEVMELDSGLRNWAAVIAGALDGAPGDGAAGGVGFALRTIGQARMASGAALVAECAGLGEHLAEADLLITGEGCSDDQTLDGKLCATVAEIAAANGVPAVLCSGALRSAPERFDHIFAAAFSIAAGPGSLDEALAATAGNLRRAGRNLAGLAGVFASCNAGGAR